MVQRQSLGAACSACRKRQLTCLYLFAYVRLPSSVPVPALTLESNNAGDRETPCRACRLAGRPCTQRFSVRFSSRRTWAPQTKSPPAVPEYADSRSQGSHSPSASAALACDQHVQVSPSRRSEPSPRLSDPQNAIKVASPLSNESASTPGGPTALASSPEPARQVIDLTSEDVNLLQYFGDSIGRPW